MLRFCELPVQPRFGFEPVELHGARREVHGTRRFVDGESGKESQFHHVRQSCAFRSQSLERAIEGDHLIGLLCGHRMRIVKTDRFCPTATFVGLSATSGIDQNASHRPGGDGHEVRSVLIFNAFDIDEVEIRLVHQCGGRQRVIRTLG